MNWLKNKVIAWLGIDDLRSAILRIRLDHESSEEEIWIEIDALERKVIKSCTAPCKPKPRVKK